MSPAQGEQNKLGTSWEAVGGRQTHRGGAEMPPAVWLGPVKSACTREGDEGLSLDRGQILGRAVAQQGAKLLISSSATGKGAAGPRRRGERRALCSCASSITGREVSRACLGSSVKLTPDARIFIPDLGCAC